MRLSNVAKNKIFADLQTLPRCIRLYEGLNISRLKFSLISPKTTKSVKIFSLEIFRLYGNLVPTLLFPFCILECMNFLTQIYNYIIMGKKAVRAEYKGSGPLFPFWVGPPIYTKGKKWSGHKTTL